MPLQPFNYLRDYHYLSGAESVIDFGDYNPFSMETQAGYRKYQSYSKPDLLVPTSKSVISNGIRTRVEALLNHEALNGLSEGFRLHTWSSKSGKDKFFYQVSRRRDCRPITIDDCADIDPIQVTAVHVLFTQLRQQYSVFIDLEPSRTGLDSKGLLLDQDGDLLLNSRNLVSLYSSGVIDSLSSVYQNQEYLDRLKDAVLGNYSGPGESGAVRVLH